MTKTFIEQGFACLTQSNKRILRVKKIRFL